MVIGFKTNTALLVEGLSKIKGDAKKMIQTLLTVGAFGLKNSHFYLICQKIDTLSFLMSYCRYL